MPCDVNIIGPGAGKLIISGNNENNIFQFYSGSQTVNNPVTISGLSLIDAKAQDGAIYSDNSLTLKNVVISGNSSSFDAGGFVVSGASVPQNKIDVSIINSRITGNSSSNGAGGVRTL